MSKVHIYYAPIYFAEKDPADTHCTLLIRRYQRHKSASGKWVTKFNIDSIVYPTPEAMATAIEKENMHELAPESDGNPMYIPPRLRSPVNRKVSSL